MKTYFCVKDPRKVQDILDDYDWQEAFKYADGTYGSPIDAVPGQRIVDLDPIRIEDVTEIVGAQEGEPDETDWIMFGKVKDGRYFFLKAGCDYTGWD